YFERGKHVVIEQGFDQLSTRMYTSLRELIAGWGKNVFAVCRYSMPMGVFVRILFPLSLISAPLFGLLPSVLLLTNVFVALPSAVILFAWITQIALWLWWLGIYVKLRQSPIYAIIFPIGSTMTLYIFLRAMLRGQRVTWKGRTYLSR